MATLQELMAEVLGETNQGQEKTASASKVSSTAEVDQMLENLGLQGAESVKTASAAAEKKNGGNMSLSDIYEQIMGGIAPEAGQEKTAAAGDGATQTTEGDEQSTAFGELVAEYFAEIAEPYYEKVASDLETEAGKGETPLQHVQTGGSMTTALGKPAEPRLEQNHSASSGAAIHAAVQNSTPYALREAALKKTILKRMAAAPVGNIVD
jgi:hypothetical protein